MKELIKKLLPGFILSFAMSFMLFIYEPIVMYSNNVNDFGFDLKILFGKTSIFFIFVFIIASVLLTICHYVCEKILKKEKIYNVILIIGYIIFIAAYIEANYLAGMLPSLDGSTIIWSNYTKATVISLLVWAVVTGAVIFMCIIYKQKKTINVLKYISLAICAMLFVSLMTTIFTTEALDGKAYAVSATNKNLNKYSSDENFIIFLLDAVDSKTFNDVVESNDEYKKVFSDFTYYPDTLCAYPFTRDSIPFILSGIWNYNEEEFSKYYTRVLDKSPLLKELEDRDFDINLYESEVIYNSKNAERIENLSFDNDYDFKGFITQEMKYVLFKHLPFALKKYSKVEKINFNGVKKSKDENFVWNNRTFYFEYMNDFEETDKKQFKFIHIEGGHVAFDLDKDLNYIEDGTYSQKLEACITVINKYFSYLKENGVYDNSNIIVMADHGFEYDDALKRLNSILYIKGKDETHDMQVSDKAISYADLQDAYKELLDNKKSTELFSGISSQRERKVLFCMHTEENHKVEYISNGKAWDKTSLVLTGREFNR